jgi:hypothetical protein
VVGGIAPRRGERQTADGRNYSTQFRRDSVEPHGRGRFAPRPISFVVVISGPRAAQAPFCCTALLRDCALWFLRSAVCGWQL